MIGLSNDVEAGVCVKLFKNHSFVQTKRFTFRGLSRKSATSQPRRENIISTTESLHLSLDNANTKVPRGGLVQRGAVLEGAVLEGTEGHLEEGRAGTREQASSGGDD